MTDRSALGCVARTVRSSGSSTGLTSVRGPPKRASRARTREAVAIGRVGSSGGADSGDPVVVPAATSSLMHPV